MLKRKLTVFCLLFGCQLNMQDQDQDGYVEPTDCDDYSSAAFPGAEEVWNFKDDNCDGVIDEGTPGYFEDKDGDGYPTDEFGGTDCDDTNPDRNPGETEICRDGVDNDCIDELAECALSEDLALKDVIAVLEGVEENGGLGASLADAGDVDGDGFDDLWVGAPESADRAGAVWLMRGGDLGRGWVSGDTPGVLGDTGAGTLGAAMVGDRDWDGDGSPDLLVSAPVSSAVGEGAVYLFAGPVLDLQGPSDASASILSPAGVDGFGTALLAADLDADGADDLVVGMASVEDDAGAVLIIPGPVPGALDLDPEELGAAWMLPGVNAQGVSLAQGDLDADGFVDLVVGQPSAAAETGERTGCVSVFSGGSDLDETWSLVGDAALDRAGTAVVSPGDINDDGYADLVVGAPLRDTTLQDAGWVYVVLGQQDPRAGLLSEASWAQIHGAEASGRLGEALGAPGNLDGDGSGTPEIAIGAPRIGALDQGLVAIFASPLDPGTYPVTQAEYSFRGTWDDGQVGAALLGGQDWSGDGYPDLMVGGPNVGVDAVGVVLNIMGAGQ